MTMGFMCYQCLNASNNLHTEQGWTRQHETVSCAVASRRETTRLLRSPEGGYQ